MKHKYRSVLALSAMAIALTACAPTVGTGANVVGVAKLLDSADHPEYSELVADGEVSSSDYEAGFELFQFCMTTNGQTVSEPRISPVDGMALIWEAGPGSKATDAEYQGVLADCYAPYGELEALYNETGPGVMDEPLRRAVQGCLTTGGYDIPDSAVDTKAIRALISDDPVKSLTALSDCLVPAAAKLYPDVAAFPIR